MIEELEGKYLALPVLAARAVDGGSAVSDRVAREIARRRVLATIGKCLCGGAYRSSPAERRPGTAPLVWFEHSSECEGAFTALLREEGADRRYIGFEVVQLVGEPHWLDQPVELPVELVPAHDCAARIPRGPVVWPEGLTLPEEGKG